MMKKAFMRGVCALNLEAMSMFHQGDQVEDQLSLRMRRGEQLSPMRLSPIPVWTPPPQAPPPLVVTTAASTPHPNPPSALALPCAKAVKQQAHERSSAAQKPGSRTITAKVTAKQEGPRLGQAGKGLGSVAMGLAPPMSPSWWRGITMSLSKLLGMPQLPGIPECPPSPSIPCSSPSPPSPRERSQVKLVKFIWGHRTSTLSKLFSNYEIG
ncbi:uncharacterized protein LOC144863055 [Branchiostoma floridae x Branchiostoma japonicum]